MRASLLRFQSSRYRQVLVACLATLGISGCLLGTILAVRWQADRAVRGDTRLVLQQATQQLTRALLSRRSTLTLLRDTFDKAPDLDLTDQQAMAKSGVDHTRHLLGIGLARAQAPLTWWTKPAFLSNEEYDVISQRVAQRTRLRNVWRVPSTFTVWSDDERPFLVMLEPLRAPQNRASALLGIFDLTPLLGDFFELTLQQPYPVQLLDNGQTLYRSNDWQGASDETKSVLDGPISLDAIQWTLQIQPGPTQAAKTISAFHIVLILFSLIAGLAAIGLIWLLLMRAWTLERMVNHRTAALQRTTERLRQLAITDELTGLYNRRFFHERWQWEYERATRYQRPLGCLMIDVNGFKRINDALGHHTGDLVLTHVAQELRTQLRQSDILARFGGDEFVVALPETSHDQTTAVAEKLRELTIQGPWADEGIGPITLSVGASQLEPGETPEQVMQRADSNLYESRRLARARSHPTLREPLAASHGPHS